MPQIIYGNDAYELEIYKWIAVVSQFLLPSFFALSGFLVAGSLARCRTVSAFVGLRMIRIFPALAVEVTLSALIMGPLLSTLPFNMYITDPDFRQYFLNLIGEIHFVLPGVFTNVPTRYIVNAQLWTIPYELICYVIITAFVFIGLHKRRVIAPLFRIEIMILFLLGVGEFHHWEWDSFDSNGVGFRSGFYLVCSFLCGLIFFLYRDDIRLNVSTIVVATVILIISTFVGGPSATLHSIVTAYLTVAIGLSNPRRIWILGAADYSYGIYLYHYVIFQVVTQFYPNNWYAVAGIGLPSVFAFAAFSWHVVENPVMALRRYLMAADRDRTTGSALLMSALTAAAMVGFVVSYNLYLFFNLQEPHALPAAPFAP